MKVYCFQTKEEGRKSEKETRVNYYLAPYRFLLRDYQGEKTALLNNDFVTLEETWVSLKKHYLGGKRSDLIKTLKAGENRDVTSRFLGMIDNAVDEKTKDVFQTEEAEENERIVSNFLKYLNELRERSISN